MTDLQSRFIQYFAAFTISVGACEYGTAVGWQSNITPNLIEGELNGLNMSNSDLIWTGSAPPLGAMISCLIIGFIADTIGRKPACFFVLIPSVAGWICLIFSTSIPMLYIARFLTGFGGGVIAIAPVYTHEIAARGIRGLCIGIMQIQYMYGVFFSNFFGLILSVRNYNILCLLQPVIFGLLFIFLQESPFYYLQKGRTEKAEKSLKLLRAEDYDISSELINLRNQLRPDHNFKTFMKIVITKAQIKAVIICCTLMIIKEYCGVTVIVHFTRRIFAESGIDLEDYIGVVLTGFLGLLGSFISASLVDSLGRIPLICLSSLLCSLCTFCIGLYFAYKQEWSSTEKLQTVEFLPAFGIILFLFSYSLGLGPISWLLCTELFDHTIKIKMNSIVCVLNLLQTFIVSKYFLDVSKKFGIHNTFYVCCALAFGCAYFILLFIPETKRKNSVEIFNELEVLCVRCNK